MNTYPKAVQQIHHEFMTASEVLLRQANEILSKANETFIEKGERLKKLGFTQTHESIVAGKMLEEKKISETVAKLVMYYQMTYPNNKFITESQVQAICDKYKLVCGPVGRYKGFVPDVKLKQIESFNIFEKDVDEGHITFDPKKYTYQLDEILKYFPDCRVPFNNFKDGDGWIRIFKDEKDSWGTLIGRIYEYSEVNRREMFICAPRKDMDMKGLSKIGALFAVVTQKRIPDPVVLKPVNGGYLVVAAWGDEASDPIVVNQRDN